MSKGSASRRTFHISSSEGLVVAGAISCAEGASARTERKPAAVAVCTVRMGSPWLEDARVARVRAILRRVDEPRGDAVRLLLAEELLDHEERGLVGREPAVRGDGLAGHDEALVLARLDLRELLLQVVDRG